MQLPGEPDRLMYNLRSENKSMDGCKHCRVTALSDDGGEMWHSLSTVPALPDPMCKGGMDSLPPSKADLNGRLIFTNDRSTTARTNLTLMSSRDDGLTWPESSAVPLFQGLAGYTDVIGIGGFGAAVVFENATCSISFTGVPLL